MQVLAANAAFYEALERLDLEGILACWDADGDVTCAHPGGGWLRGWGDVTDSWTAIVTNTEYIEFQIEDAVVRLEDPVAWVSCVERVTSSTPAGRVEGRMAALNLFVLTRAGWRLRLHHASPVIRMDGDG